MKRGKMNNIFKELSIDASLLKGIERCGYEEMTDVQQQVIPLALEGKDIMAQAPTGTGKTCSYGLPILQNVNVDNNNIQVLILAPTRELAVQITEDLREYAYYKEGIKICTLYGGEYIERQITNLKRKPQIIVATPGRLMDHMERKTVKLSNINMLVLDEADEMLNIGFKEDIDTILAAVSHEHQTMLFSATFSKEIEKITNTYLNNPEIVKITKGELTVSNISQKYILVREQDKIEVMSRIIDINGYEIVMVFCNTKKMVDEVSSGLLQRGFVVEGLHGDMKQQQRERVIARFKSKLVNILVASDVAARGLDVNDVDVVFNYDIPQDEEYYVHRVGRTGRANKDGLAITLLTESEKWRLRSIVSYSKADIQPMKVPNLDKVMSARVDRIIKGAVAAVEKDSENKYSKIIEEAVMYLSQEKTVTAEQIITGLILLQMNIDNDSNIEIIQERKAKPVTKNSRGKDISRMFISLGKKDKIKVYNLTDMLVSCTRLSNAEINNIELHDEFSFFEIPTKYLNEVLSAFSKRINGRFIVVEEAKAKEKGTSSKRRGGEGRRRSDDKKNTSTEDRGYSRSSVKKDDSSRSRRKDENNYSRKDASNNSRKRSLHHVHAKKK